MDDGAKFLELVKTLQEQDNAKRSAAEAMSKQAKADQPASVLEGVVGVLTQPTVDTGLKLQAAVLLRRCCVKGIESDFIFDKVPPQVQDALKSRVLEL